MALVRAERVLETSTTTGTGSLTLGGPVTGYRSFASVMSTNDTAYYAIVAVDSSGRPTGDWETGLATLTGATTLARTTVAASSNGGALVTLSSGTKQVFLTLTSTEIIDILASIAAKASATKVDVFTGNDVWYKAAEAKFIDIFVISGGNGGQSGGLISSLTITNVDATGGGSGNNGKFINVFYVPADIFPASVSVTVGAGGTGGASRTTSGATGNNGTSGGSSSFGGYLSTSGSGASTTSTGGSVVDGVASNGAADTPGTLVGWLQSTNNGVNSTNFAVANTAVGGTAANATSANATGGNGTQPVALSVGTLQPNGTGGGGGGAAIKSGSISTIAIAGDGSTGGYPGGGGGGGGAAAIQASSIPSGSKSGKGGNGADGVVVVITHF